MKGLSAHTHGSTGSGRENPKIQTEKQIPYLGSSEGCHGGAISPWARGDTRHGVSMGEAPCRLGGRGYCLQGFGTIWGFYRIYYGIVRGGSKMGKGMVWGGLGGRNLGKQRNKG